jgi:2'-5' RNA ligase
MSQHRLFLAIRPSLATVHQLGSAGETLARRAHERGVIARWLSPPTYHLTLKFLGWARAEVIPAVIAAATPVCAQTPAFAFTTARLGGFPDKTRATVLWAGVTEGAEPLAQLAGSLGRAMSDLGFGGDTVPFHPHITLARLPVPQAVSEVILPLAEQVFSTTRVEDIYLVESEVNTKGSEYKKIHRFVLKSAEKARERQTPPLEPSSSNIAHGSSLPRPLDPLDRINTDDGWPRGQGPGSHDAS